MAGISYYIASTQFKALSRSNARNALSIRVNKGDFVRQRFHVPGVNGNIIVRGGRTGQRIICRMRYIDTLANVLTAVETDRLAWEDTAVTIQDDKSTSYTLCNMEAFERVNDPVAIQGAKVMLDMQATFTRDS
jgi:hypothetical protein